jgi:hypothetical protein
MINKHYIMNYLEIKMMKLRDIMKVWEKIK